MIRALLAGLLTVVATSVIGTWVVLRGMSFLGDALAHGVLPGIAVAFIAGFDTTVGAMVAALVMVGLVHAVRTRSPLPDDVGIGLLFVGMLSFGVVIISSRRSSYVGDLNRFLFGSVTGVDSADLLRLTVVAVVAVAGTLVLYRALLVLTFDETLARMVGLRPRLTHLALLTLMALAIVATFGVVGNLLVIAFLIAPPATAVLVARRVPVIMAVAVALGAVSVVVGILISFHAGTAASATMALVSVALFLVVLVLRPLIPGARALGPRTR
ncbi:MAG TPA: metal ABC transporter permease [Acidimicrobiales bacterium]|nr:metal ABC transporter permease [Acidimicrobiales bacterium]